MTDLNGFLAQKRTVLLERKEKINLGESKAVTLAAHVSAEGRSGVRRIRIRDFQIISDSGPDFAGYNLGPSSPELVLGTLGSCLNHVFLIHAAQRGVPLDSLEVDVSGTMDPRAGKPGFEDVPFWPHDISYKVLVTSPASEADLEGLHEAVGRTCPILNLFIRPQEITGELVHTIPDGK